jgi:hypothetical protein
MQMNADECTVDKRFQLSSSHGLQSFSLYILFVHRRGKEALFWYTLVAWLKVFQSTKKENTLLAFSRLPTDSINNNTHSLSCL